MENAGVVSAEKVEVVVAHDDRATLRIGDVFVKIDADQTRTDVEVEAVAMASGPTLVIRRSSLCPSMRRSAGGPVPGEVSRQG